MTAFDEARVVMFAADHAVADPAGKINALGMGFNLLGIDPRGGNSAPMSVVVLIDLPPEEAGKEFTVSLELRRQDTGAVVQMPTPSGDLEALRIGQTVTPNLAQVPPVFQRPQDLGCRAQIVLNFPTGLRLESGVSYYWRLEIDGRSRLQWRTQFHVLKAKSGPVIGGPVAPVDPDMPSLGPDVDDEEL